MTWLIENLPSIFVLLAVLGFAALLVWSLVRAKRSGKSACAGCSGCSMRGSCSGSCQGSEKRLSSENKTD